MRALFLSALLFFPLLCFGADSTWILKQSTLTYTAFHTFHDTEGINKEAKGKGVCSSGVCEFLVAAEVKAFDSGDGNRKISG